MKTKPGNQENDEQIIEQILKGEKQLYEELIRKYNERLFRISMSIVNDEAEAKDIIQTTYLKAYEKLPEFKKKSVFGTWITTILINESLLRKKKKLKQHELAGQQPVEEINTPLKKLLDKELKAVLEKAIANLPEKYGLVFVMREIEEMSIKETMDVLNISESNVKIRLSRAKEMLRENLTEKKLKQVFKFRQPLCDKIVEFVLDKIAITFSKK